MTLSYLEIRSPSAQLRRYPIEETQLSVTGEWNNGCALEVRSLYYFEGAGPHELTTPPEQRGPLFQFDRPLTTEIMDRHGAIQALQLSDARFEATEIPFPAGISFGACHLGVSRLNYSLIWLRDLEFQCRADGCLQRIGDDPEGLDGATFRLDVQLPFDGVWLESADPADKEQLNRFYDAFFGKLNLKKDFDEFADGVVLRAYR